MPSKKKTGESVSKTLPRVSLNSLRSKFLASVIPMVLGVIVVVFGVFEYRAERRAETHLQENLDSLIAYQSRALSEPIMKGDSAHVRFSVNALIGDPDITSVEIFRTQDGTEFSPLHRAAKPSLNAAYFAEEMIYGPGPAKSDPIGKIVVGVSRSRIIAEARERFLFIGILALSLIAGVIGSILFAYRRNIDRPLTSLLKSIRTTRRGQSAPTVEWTSSDEIGAVISAFNDMLRQQKKHENELRVAKEDLEDRVAARTHQVGVAMRQLNEAIESASEGFSLFDAQDRLIMCNSKYKRMVKPNANESELERVFRPGTPFVDLLRNAVDSQNILVPPGQEETWIDDQLGRRRSPDGRVVQLLINGQWIRVSERRTLDGSVVAVYSNVTELEEARLAAEAASEAKSTFLATMSHEIRTPMNGVLGMLEVLERSRLDDEQRRMTETIGKSAMALLGVIDDILDFSKIEAGEIEIERSPTVLRTTCESVLTLFAPAAEQKDLDLALIITPELAPLIHTDPLRLRQVLVNLLGNAMKFTTSGSIVMRVGPAQNDPGRIRFEVTDSGIGMAKEQLSRIFLPFRQAENSTTRKFGGTGLGLAISQRLVEKMDGSIGVRSGAGKGSSFWFELPYEPVSQSHEGPNAGPDLSHKDVLVVTSSNTVFEMLESVLSDAGAEVRQVKTADAAKTILHAEKQSSKPPDLVIIDGRRSFEAFTTLPALATLNANDRMRIGLHFCKGSELIGKHSNAINIISRDRVPTRFLLLQAAGQALGLLSPNTGTPPQLEQGPHPDPHLSTSNQDGDKPLILVVDDHETNRFVIQQQLTTIGYASQVAGDGEEALAMWRETPFALILCDCHMPVLDGFGLTARIRSIEARSGSHTPIIALTANALAGEADVCIAAGMDEYLSKPVGIQRLKETLTRWINQTGNHALEAPQTDVPLPRIEAAGIEDDPFDREAWTSIIGRAGVGFIHEYIAKLKPHLTETIAELDEQLEREDLTAIAEAAHKGAAAAGFAGARDLSEVFKRLENAARDNLSVAPLIEKARMEIDRILAWNPSGSDTSDEIGHAKKEDAVGNRLIGGGHAQTGV